MKTLSKISNRTKILLATPIYPPDIGGPATYTQRLANQLSQKGFEVIVITFSEKEIAENTDFSVITISRAYPKVIRHFLYLLELLRLAQKSDVIYAQSPVNVGFPSLIASKILRKKLILKVVGDAAWESYATSRQKFDDLETFQKKDYGFFIEAIRSIQKLVAKNVDSVIAPSQYLKKIISDWGVPEEKINVVYNVPTEESSSINISNEEAKNQVGFKGNIILSIGRLSPWKGFQVLIEVMPDLLKENPNFKLLIIGSGEEKEKLVNKIINLKVANSVKLVGRVNHSEIPLYFKAADMFVLNSQYEGLSHVILEAMQSGTPIIASNQGGNPELIQDDFNGLLVKYNDTEQLKRAILKLWQSRELKEKFIKNSKEKIKEMSWENLVQNTLKILL